MSREEEEAFFSFEEKTSKKTKQTENDDSVKKTKIKLSPYQLREIKKKEFRGKKLKQKDIAKFTGYTDRMIRY
ncbi:MAG: hypothetical protein NY202_04455 [Mollicutes bacterium UO1]